MPPILATYTVDTYGQYQFPPLFLLRRNFKVPECFPPSPVSTPDRPLGRSLVLLLFPFQLPFFAPCTAYEVSFFSSPVIVAPFSPSPRLSLSLVLPQATAARQSTGKGGRSFIPVFIRDLCRVTTCCGDTERASTAFLCGVGCTTCSLHQEMPNSVFASCWTC